MTILYIRPYKSAYHRSLNKYQDTYTPLTEKYQYSQLIS